jgi:hypothetical protein
VDVTDWVPIVISSAGGAIVTLLGAVTGGVIASRSQRRHWIRDKQVDACAAIVAESTRGQLAMRRLWRRGERADWGPWNLALALISLTASPAVIAAAEKMDATFWRSTRRMEEREEFDEEIWMQVVEDLQLVRRDFINCARKEIVGMHQDIERLPIVTPPARNGHGHAGTPSAGPADATAE